METNKYELAYPNPVPEGVSLEKNLYAEMRDGIKIAVDVYRPADAQGALPVILAYSSFPKERIFESAKPSYYCKHGYICVQAAERGIGLNEGKFSFQGPKAAEDGYDLIEWIAAQPWCDGNVAMMGASGYGVMQWLTAPLNPPHLKALAVLATTDNYRGLCYPGGVLRKAFVEYLITSITIGAQGVPTGAGAGFVCIENASAGQFTVPASILTQLPASGTIGAAGFNFVARGTFSITAGGKGNRLTASGVDILIANNFWLWTFTPEYK